MIEQSEKAVIKRLIGGGKGSKEGRQIGGGGGVRKYRDVIKDHWNYRGRTILAYSFVVRAFTVFYQMNGRVT
jgi:hypothetical protein